MINEYKKNVLEKYQKRTRTSKETFEQAKKFLPGGNSRSGTFWRPYPTYFSRGKGFTIWDIDDNEYIDFINNMTSLIHGHAHPNIVKAIQETAEIGTAYNWPTEYAIKLAKMLCERIPSFERVRFTNSGTEATMMAVRLAMAYTGKDKFLKGEGVYHGTHISVDVSVSLDPNQMGDITNPKGVPGLGVPQSIVDNTIIFPWNDKESTEAIFQKNKDDLAAIIVEPLCMRIKPEKDFLQFLREITIENDVLLIFDEVISARVSRGGAQERYKAIPDITAVGKIFGGGLPFGGFGGREDIMTLTDPSQEKFIAHAGTFNANPITMAAGYAATTMLTPSAYEKLEHLGESQRKGVKKTLEEIGVKMQITGDASLTRLHFTEKEVKTVRLSKQAESEKKYLHQILHLSMLNKGISLPTRTLSANSTVMTNKEIQSYNNALRESLEWMKPLIKSTAPELIE
jgi:glutamate-1-semialdehyde 2,1-aminomutase